MAPLPAEAFASQLQQLAAKSLPFVERITPHVYTAPDGKAYYSAYFRLHHQDTDYQSECSSSPLTAYRTAEKAILRTIGQHPSFTPTLPAYATADQ